MLDSIHEECGVFGIFNHSNTKINISKEVYTALYALQHRGQQSSGIAVNLDGQINVQKDLGLVNEVFNEITLNTLEGNIACGHVRYDKQTASSRDNIQPFLTKHTKGQIAVAINGNLVNADSLRDELSEKGAMFQTTSDAEIVAYIIGRERIKTDSTEQAILNIMDKLHGAYSMVIVTMNKLIAVRDPKGFRPLCMGKLGESTIIASESCAIDALDGKFVRDIEPGEIVVVEKNGIKSLKDKCGQKTSSCIFEHIYFARPDSVIDGQSVHFARKEAGRQLAISCPADADIVVGVPDSAIDSALGYAEQSKIPYSMGVIKNRYVGRTFIEPLQTERARQVKLKLNPVASILKGKRVVLIDDSIVRGTTTAYLVSMLRDAGAKEVHMRISSPPYINTCYFGTDIESKDKLMAVRLSMEEIRVGIDADSLGYLPIEALSKIVKDSRNSFCCGCFTGVYPLEVGTPR